MVFASPSRIPRARKRAVSLDNDNYEEYAPTWKSLQKVPKRSILKSCGRENVLGNQTVAGILNITQNESKETYNKISTNRRVSFASHASVRLYENLLVDYEHSERCYPPNGAECLSPKLKKRHYTNSRSSSPNGVKLVSPIKHKPSSFSKASIHSRPFDRKSHKHSAGLTTDLKYAGRKYNTPPSKRVRETENVLSQRPEHDSLNIVSSSEESSDLMDFTGTISASIAQKEKHFGEVGTSAQNDVDKLYDNEDMDITIPISKASQTEIEAVEERAQIKWQTLDEDMDMTQKFFVIAEANRSDHFESKPAIAAEKLDSRSSVGYKKSPLKNTLEETRELDYTLPIVLETEDKTPMLSTQQQPMDLTTTLSESEPYNIFIGPVKPCSIVQSLSDLSEEMNLTLPISREEGINKSLVSQNMKLLGSETRDNKNNDVLICKDKYKPPISTSSIFEKKHGNLIQKVISTENAPIDSYVTTRLQQIKGNCEEKNNVADLSAMDQNHVISKSSPDCALKLKSINSEIKERCKEDVEDITKDSGSINKLKLLTPPPKWNALLPTFTDPPEIRRKLFEDQVLHSSPSICTYKQAEEFQFDRSDTNFVIRYGSARVIAALNKRKSLIASHYKNIGRDYSHKPWNHKDFGYVLCKELQAESFKNALLNLSPSKRTPEHKILKSFESRPKFNVQIRQDSDLKQIISPFKSALSNEDNNPRKTLQDYEYITLSQFLELAHITFMDGLTTAKYQKFRAPRGILPTVQTPRDFAEAAIITIPSLEMFQFGCNELNKYIVEGRDIVKKIENDSLDERPLLFHEYTAAPKSVKDLMDKQFKIIKAYARIQAKGVWYSWREKLLEGVETIFQTNNQLMSQDMIKIKAAAKTMEVLFDEIKMLRSKSQILLKKFRSQKKELDSCDGKAFITAKDQIVSFNGLIKKNKSQIETIREQIGAHVKQLEQTKLRTLFLDKSVQRFAHEASRKNSSSFLLQEPESELSAIHDALGWKLLHLDDSNATLVYRGSMVAYLVFPTFHDVKIDCKEGLYCPDFEGFERFINNFQPRGESLDPLEVFARIETSATWMENLRKFILQYPSQLLCASSGDEIIIDSQVFLKRIKSKIQLHIKFRWEDKSPFKGKSLQVRSKSTLVYGSQIFYKSADQRLKRLHRSLNFQSCWQEFE